MSEGRRPECGHGRQDRRGPVLHRDRDRLDQGPGQRVAVKQIVDAAHIKVGYAGQSALLVQQLNLNSLDEEARGRAVAQVRSSIDEAAELGSERVAFLTGRTPATPTGRPPWKRCTNPRRELCHYGRSGGSRSPARCSIVTSTRSA